MLYFFVRLTRRGLQAYASPKVPPLDMTTTHLSSTISNPTAANNNSNNNHHIHQYHYNSHANSILECKSKYDAEFRRFGLPRFGSIHKFDDFYALLERLHGLVDIPFNIFYTDKDGELLPINNDNNLARVLQVTAGLLRLVIFRRGECYPEQQLNGGPHIANVGLVGSGALASGQYGSAAAMNYSNINSVNASATPSYRAANLINHIKGKYFCCCCYWIQFSRVLFSE